LDEEYKPPDLDLDVDNKFYMAYKKMGVHKAGDVEGYKKARLSRIDILRQGSTNLNETTKSENILKMFEEIE